MTVNTEAILALPTAEKLELIGLIWDNLSESESNLPKEVELEAVRRRDEMLADPNLGLTHDEAWAKIAKRNG
jgi:putative addiction module component (TIGR02574 family)